MMSSLVTADWVAQRLGEPKHRIYRWARDGVIPCVHIGRRMKFDREVIEEWIATGGQALPGGWKNEAA
jgi:excisionase family DNA binding protein